MITSTQNHYQINLCLSCFKHSLIRLLRLQRLDPQNILYAMPKKDPTIIIFCDSLSMSF